MTNPFEATQAVQDENPFTKTQNTSTKPAKGFMGQAKDLGLSLLKGAIAVPETVVGLADLATGGQAGKLLENEGGAVGFRPKQAKEFLSGLQTDQLQDQRQQFSEADGIIDKAGVALSNPSLIANTVAESAPAMLGGGVVGRGVMAVAPRLGAVGAGAIGEGIMGAGSSAEQIRQETTDGLLTGQQAGLAGLSGVATAGFGALGGKVASKLGIGDVDTMLVQGTTQAAGQASRKGVTRQTIEGAISEGLLEELPQSVSEQLLQNLALGKSWDDGMDEAIVMGTLAGMAMGGPAAGVSAFASKPSPDVAPPPPGTTEPAPEPTPPALGFNPTAGTSTVFPDGTVILNSESANGEQAVFDKRFAPQPVIKPSEAMGLDPAAGSLSAAAVVAVDSGAHDTAVSAQNQALAQAAKGNNATETVAPSAPATAPNNAPGLMQAAQAAAAPGMAAQSAEQEAAKQANIANFQATQAAAAPAAPTAAPEAVPASDAQAPAAAPTPQERLAKINSEIASGANAETGARLTPFQLGVRKAQANQITSQLSQEPANPAKLQAAAPAPAAPVAASQSIEGAPIDKEWSAFTPESGTLSVPRADMPQIKAEARGAMVNFLKARGIASEPGEVPADSLKPTQAEFSPAKVAQANGFVGGDRSILVSSDGHVLDGHHQWLAKREAGAPVKVIRLDAPIADLLPIVKEFPSAAQAQPAQAAIKSVAQPQGLPNAQTNEAISQQPQPEASAGAVAGAADEVAPAGPVHLGRNNTPLSEGGKPFKTRLDATGAKKMQPMMRVVSVKGGFALADKTEKQLAAEAKSARRLRNPQTSPPGEPIPVHAFIASEGGLHKDTRPDMNIGANPRVGAGWLFAGKGKGVTMERATARLVEEGYLREGASHSEAAALIKRSLTHPQYNPDGVERMAIAEEEARYAAYELEMEEAVAEAESVDDNEFHLADDSDIPFGDTPSNTSHEAAMRALGFTEQEIQDEAIANRSRVAQADSKAGGSPVEAASSDAQAGDGQRAPAQGQDEGLSAPIFTRRGDFWYYTGDQAQKIADALELPVMKGGMVSIPEHARDEWAGQLASAGISATFEGTQTAAEGLSAPSQQDVLDQQARAESAAKSEKAQQRAADEMARRERERKDIAKASEFAADSFVLGGDAEQNLSGQGGMFDDPAASPAPKAQAKPAPAKKQPSADELRAQADLSNALADLGDIFSKPFKANLTEEQTQKLLPVLTRVLDAAFRLGYAKFKDAAKFALDQIKTALGAEVADALTLDHLQGAYIAMAGGKPGTDTKRAVIDIEDKSEIESHTAKTDNERNEESNAPSTDGRVERDSAEPAAEPAMGDAVPDDAAGAAAGTSDAGGRAGGSTGRGQQDRSGVPFGSAPVAGERGDQSVSAGNPTPELAGILAGSDFSERGGDSGIEGIPPESVPAAEVDAAADTSPTGLKAGIARAQADKTPIKLGDLENIRATLPQLLPGQDTDVLAAETRFADPTGYGMLFTNGTGTGKTFSGLGIIKRFARQGKTTTLIVAPDDKIAADWMESGKLLGLDISKLADTKDAGKGIVITTYANLGENDALAGRQWDLVVADEAHTLMQAADGKPTGYLQNLRAITLHPEGVSTRFSMLNRTSLETEKSLSQWIKQAKLEKRESAVEKLGIQDAENQLKSLSRQLDENRKRMKSEVAAKQGAGRTRLVGLSATPFAYEKTIDWANGYLFEYKDGYPFNETSGAYNQPSPREYYFQTRFGYSMRYNKLNRPGAGVDSGLMQRMWNGEIKKSGALSGRMLDVAPDYDRRFVLVQSAIGNRIDEALAWLNEQRQNAAKDDAGFGNLAGVIGKQFEYLEKRYLLEAIKATEVIPIVKGHLAMGRKVVVFHDYKKGGGFNPFKISPVSESTDPTKAGAAAQFNAALAQFNQKFADLVNHPFEKMGSPIDVFSRELPGVLLINGDEKKADLLKRYKLFQDDSTGPLVMLVQSAKNKGWSGHDTTGKNQRVLINLGQPTAPTLAIQQEGRIYRTGQATDAIMRYLNTGTNWERWTFASTIASRASTAENLGMGEAARALKDSFIQSFEESDTYAPGHEDEGKGGKERDKAANNALTEFDRAKALYAANQKKNTRTKAQEGKDYFATPEPLGLKMVEWLDARSGEDMLEPSGGHGAIARWFPEKTKKTVIEPSLALRSRLALAMDAKEDRIIDGTFEDHAIVNKYDGIAMNPPFGTAGRTAMDHIAKAAMHLRDGGRLVALLPVGSADAKFDKWFYESSEKPAKPLFKTGEFTVYKGDTLTMSGFGADFQIIAGEIDRGLYVRATGQSKSDGVNISAIKSVKPTGQRTESYRPAADLHLVASIKLPSVTFERAGTAVNTRIVILEKQADKAFAPAQQYERDLSDVESIKELFDRLENLTFPKRPKVQAGEAVEAEPGPVQGKAEKPAKAAKPAPTEVELGASVMLDGKSYEVSTYTTNAGKALRGVWVPTQAQALTYGPSTFQKRPLGWFVRERDLPAPEAPAAPAFSRGTGQRSASMAQDQVQAITDRIAAAWANAPQIVVAANMDDPRIPQSARDEDQKQRSLGATGNSEGFFFGGKVYLLADSLTSPSNVAEVLLHESVGHYGMRGAFGDLLTPILQQLATMRKAEVTAKAQQYGLDMSLAEDRLVAAEEVLAELAQTQPTIGFVRRAIAAIRTWLRKHMPMLSALELTDAEIVANILIPARRFVERGNQAQTRGRASFSRSADQTVTSAFKAWYGDWQNAANGNTETIGRAEALAGQPSRGAANDAGGADVVHGVQRSGNVDTDHRRPVQVGSVSFPGTSGPVGEDSRPVRLYHGTRDDVDAFKVDHANRLDKGWLGRGVYATNSSDLADAHAEFVKRPGNAEPNTMPLFMAVRNPYVATNALKLRLKNASQEYIDRFTQDLKAKGHDGVVMAFDDGHVELMAFEPTQVKSAIGNVGAYGQRPITAQEAKNMGLTEAQANEAQADGDIRFSRASKVADKVGAAIKASTVTNLKTQAGYKMTDYLGLGLQTLGRRQLLEIYGDTLPLDEYNRLVAQMEADKNETGANADELANQWGKLQDEGKLADLMHDATLAQIDPATPLAKDDNAMQHSALQARFNALSPDAQKIYKQARDAYRAHHKKVRDAIKARIERSELKGPKKAALLKDMDTEFMGMVKGVYFPLSRFGQYVVVTKGPDGKVANVSRAETMAEGQEARRTMLQAFPAAKGFTTGKVVLSKEFVASRDSVGRGFMTNLYDALDKQGMDAQQRSELEDTLGQLYLQSLPDLSWAKHGLHRKGTAGFSQDARRAFAQNMFHGAGYLAKLNYSDLMQDELATMQKHVDAWVGVPDEDMNSARAQRVVDEFNKRHETLMNPKGHPISTALTSFGFLFHLGLSPASALVNLSQTALVALPIMGAKWGFTKSSSALLTASKEAASNKNDISKVLKGDELLAYNEAVRTGTIDVTNAHDLAGIAQGEDAGVMWKIRPVMKWASFLFHHAERFNRQVTFVAAYRLARAADANITHAAAYEQAVKATYDGHFDYSASNRPRIMQGNWQKVILLFKQYAQNMIYTLARQAHQALKAETPAGRLQARKALGGLLVSHALAAGVFGLPMVGMLLSAASALGSDDDEPWDAKTALQNMLAESVSPEFAEVFTHGLSRLTPWDISGRVGLDKLLLPDIQEGLSGARAVESWMSAALGPVAGIAVNAGKGMSDIAEGRYLRGLESMLPTALRGPLKAYRYGTEGNIDKSGIAINDEISVMGWLGQGAGFSPSEARKAQEGKSAIHGADSQLSQRRSELLRQYAAAAMAGDAQGQAEIRESITRFNEKNPDRRIQPLQLVQSVRMREKRIREAEGGVYLTKTHRDAFKAGQFAASE